MTGPLPATPEGGRRSATERVATARCALFVPGDRPERFSKATASGADLVIIDLEDAVAPEHKASARRHAVTWLSGSGRAAVRVNAVGAKHFEEDRAALAGLRGLQAVVVPMTEDPGALAALADHLGARVPVVALIETARGVLLARQLAEVPGVARLGIGHLDLAADLDSSADRPAMLLSRSTLVLASRAAGIAGPLDGVTTNLDDPAVCADDAGYARRLGFTGKLAIHPVQVGPIISAFSPGPEEISWADRVLDAAGQGGAVRVDGEMVDGPVVARARQILKRAQRSATP